MIPWQELGRATLPSGELVLTRRGEEYAIRLRGLELMNSRMHHSEEELARLGCAGLGERVGVRVLIGGLGMGFTTRAALTAVSADARIEIAELLPEVVAWNRGPLADLAGRPLEDPRVTVEVTDVTRMISEADGEYDAILLDVDNGPDAFTAPANARLYGHEGLKRARRALAPGGMLGVWSVADDAAFTGRLKGVGFHVEVHHVTARKAAGPPHTLWMARAPRGAQR